MKNDIGNRPRLLPACSTVTDNFTTIRFTTKYSRT